MISLTDAKQQATILKDFLRQSNTDISQSSCLQAMAKMNGFRDWNTMSATLKNKQKQVKKNNFLGDPIQISASVFLSMSNHGGDGNLGEDAYQLLSVIVYKLKDNSPIVEGITRRSLWQRGKWTQERFDKALNQLINERFIYCSYDNNRNLIITVNPLYFWKGEEDKHSQAIDFYNKELYDSINENRNADFPSVIKFAKDRNLRETHLKKVPLLDVSNSINLDDHPKLKELQIFLDNQEPVFDPRVYLPKVNEILGTEYYIGYGGNHIHIKSADKEREIAFIVAET